ncbi:MAG: ParB/RepB/Spo0J family partition protein [Firmicutes bacterium]|nr:ParB/RepB/Spo0J family partition protein [Bacillota bacterium]MBR3391384.1 ParB/RepB/Spo0J family partition protein [Bacillota bacterium]
MAKKQALGRGLSALLPDEPAFLDGAAAEQVRQLAIDSVRPNPDQPRKLFDPEKLEELTASIRQHGVMQPLVVVEREGGYMIAAGERRWRAAQAAGLKEVPALVRQLDPRELAELSLIENLQREDLTGLEEAQAFSDLMNGHGYTQEALAERLGKSRSHVANTLRLLNLAPHEKKLLEQGKFSPGHARAILSLEENSPERVLLVSAVIKQGLSVRQAEEQAQRLKTEQAEKASKKPAKKQTATLIHEDLARQISRRLGVKARISGRGGRGRVTLDFNSEDDLQNIVDALLE